MLEHVKLENLYISCLYILQSQISNCLEKEQTHQFMNQRSQFMNEQYFSLNEIQSKQSNPDFTESIEQNYQKYQPQINIQQPMNSTSINDSNNNLNQHSELECQPSIQISINTFEICESALHGQKLSQYNVKHNNQDVERCLQSLQYALTRIYYRKFHNRLITCYIQSLKEEQKKIRQTNQLQIKLLKQQNWPFKELFYKKYRNPNEEILFQFVNMCAQKIQSTFKTYITCKRHKQALKKINNFKSKLQAVLIGWKTWNVYNCKKINEVRNKFIRISQQIDGEIQNPNIDRFKKMKKIEYLNSSQQVFKQNFMKSFDYLYNSGAWIYEVDMCFKKSSKKGFNNYGSTKYHHLQQLNSNTHSSTKLSEDQNITLQSKNDFKIKEKQLPKKGRQRQFKASENRNARKEDIKQFQIGKNQQNNDQKFKFQPQNSTNYQSSQFEQRPIIARGKYQLNQDDIKSNQNQFLQMNEQKQFDKQKQSNEQTSSPRINKFRNDQKKKLIKRQKYDPRKAIQDQKKRLEEEKRKKIETKNEIFDNPQQQQKIPKKLHKNNSQISKKTPRKIKKQEPKRELQSPRQSSKQKTVQKIKKQIKLSKKGDNSKSIKSIVSHKRVESKIDCWGPKKESLIEKNPSNQDISYKSKFLTGLKQKNQNKIGQNRSYINHNKSRNQIMQGGDERSLSINKYTNSKGAQDKSIGKSDQHQKGKQYQSEETYKSNYLKKLVEERDKGSFSNANERLKNHNKIVEKLVSRKQDSISQRFQQLNINIKRLSQNKSLQGNSNVMIQQRKSISNKRNETTTQKNKQQAYRPIQSLQEVYSSQYTDRLNNLKNKLNMLESTRYIQRDQSIPVLLQDSKFMKKMYKDHTFSSLYWPQVRTMETTFLDYIKFSGF